MTFTPGGLSQLVNALPQLQTAELRLRGVAVARGIEYSIADYGGLRTDADTARLIQWRDEAVAAARAAGEKKRQASGGNATQVKAAGEAAAQAAYYRVSPAATSYHPLGAAFDIRVTKAPAGVDGYAALGAEAPRLGLRWGGTFSAPADIYHFELAVSRDQAAALWHDFQATGGAAGREAATTVRQLPPAEVPVTVPTTAPDPTSVQLTSPTRTTIQGPASAPPGGNTGADAVKWVAIGAGIAAVLRWLGLL